MVDREFVYVSSAKPYLIGLTAALLTGAMSLAWADANNEGSGFTSVINERSIESRVLGGGDAEEDAWPSIVALVQSGERPLHTRLFCGGTLVSSQWVMTAAHCLYDQSNVVVDSSTLKVVGGITNLQTQSQVPEIGVASIIIHPDYDPYQELPPNDIALLELQSALDMPVATLFSGETETHAQEFAWVAGWGATSYQNDIPGNYPAALQDAAVPVVANAVCNSPQSYDGLITATHLCAGYVEGEVDACAGDSGGPLFLLQEGVSYQIGITSFGNGCGLPLFYGIYTNVSHYIPWLANYIEVPYQSPDLVASRQNVVTDPGNAMASSDSSRSFIGSFGFMSIYLMLALVACRTRRARKCVRDSN